LPLPYAGLPEPELKEWQKEEALLAAILGPKGFRMPTGTPRLDVDLIVDRAVEVIGDRNQALRWLGTPIRALDYATPISMLGTSEGTARVQDLLGQIEHGVL